MAEQSNPSDANRLLAMLAFQLRIDPEYMASVLFQFRESESLDEQLLADRLSISRLQLTRLALCKRPQSDAKTFADQVRQIATYSGADPSLLAAIIRQVDALAAVRNTPHATQTKPVRSTASLSPVGWLAAARDRSTDESSADEVESGESEAID